MSNVKKNYIYNIVYEIIKILIPIITVPYISRVLGATGVGIYSYTYSIVVYFMYFSLLGINNYGNRTIAKVRDDKQKMSKTFYSIYAIQIIMTIIMTITYLSYLVFFDNKYFTIALIQIIYILSCAFDINWFFFGIEKFKLTVFRSSLVKILSLILILLFVKNSNDLWLYTIILAGSTFISQIILILFLKKEISFVKINWKDIKPHIKPTLLLFIPVIAISLYKIMDKIMLGIISDIREVGYYEQAEKIISIPLSVISALGTVMLPKISNLFSKNKFEDIKRYLEKSFSFVLFLSFAMTFGIITVAKEFTPIFFGTEFEKTGYIMMLLSTTIPFIAFANVLRTQYLIPKELDKIYIQSVILGSIINLTMNLMFIPYFGSIGACIGTISAELIVSIYQSIYVRKEIPIMKYIKNSLIFLLFSIIMFAIIWPINYLNINGLYKIIIQVILGFLIYSMLNIKYILSTINFKKRNNN